MSDESSTPETPDTEIERLRREVDRLRAEVDAPEATAKLPVQPAPRRGWWRPVVATLLIIVMAILAPLAVVARWAHDTVSDTDRYIETVGPLAENPDVQAAVIDRITTEITSRLQVEDVTKRAVDALESRGLPPRAASSLQLLTGPLTNAINGFIEEQVTRLVESDEFQQAWEEANREAHTQMVAVLTGKDTDVVQISNNAVSINLATVIDAVKQRLVDQGFGLAARLPQVQAQFTIFQSSDITKAQNGFRLLNAINTWLPILALICLLGAVAVGRSRRRTLIAGTLALALSMLLLGVVLNVFRAIYLDAVPADDLPPDAAGAIYDQLAGFIRLSLRAVLALALVVAFIAWVTGPERAPTALRRGTTSAIDVVRHGGERAGLDTGRFGVFLHTYKTPLRIAVLAIALVIYILEDHPTGTTVVVLVIVAAVVLLIIELLARPPAAAPAAEAIEPSETSTPR
jgi:hypothetical protein